MLSVENIIDFLTVLGSLMLFVFGMKVMSEALQKLSGKNFRVVFSKMAANPFRAIVGGLLITGVMQSSSAVTVVLVSFVNSGIFSLSQGLGIMMGANIGTTITAWLITLFGFKFQFTTILLPVLGLGLPLLFLPGSKNRSIAEFILGFAILFLGLQFMKDAMSDIGEASVIVRFLSSFSDHGPGNILFFALLGFIITLLIQSSSATIILTIVMCYSGYISFEIAAAMILGQNLGTTITANLAAITANRAAKRIALGHSLFNFIGIIWALILFFPMVNLAQSIALWMSGNNIHSASLIPIGLSVFHTGFNLVNTLLLVGFIPLLKKLLEKIIVLKPNEKKTFRLRYFKSRFIAMNEVDILQAHEQIAFFGRHVAYMFNLIPEYLTEKREPRLEKIQRRLLKSEEEADALDYEITDFITRIAENDLSVANSRKIRAMLKITDELESIADQCFQMERTIRHKNEAKAWFTQVMRDDLFTLFDLVTETLKTMNENLARDYRPGILAKATEQELQVNEMRDKLIQTNRVRLESGEYNHIFANFYSQLLNQCEKLADHVINVNEAIASNTK